MHKGLVYTHDWRGTRIARSWPRFAPNAWSEEQKQNRRDFAWMAKNTKNVWAVDQASARLQAKGTLYIWRDIVSLAMVGRLIEMVPIEPGLFDVVNIQELLDQISSQPGAMLMRAPTQWVALIRMGAGNIVTWDDDLAMPVWGELVDTGINELHGDVIAGPGDGNQLATLANTAVIPGTYTNANLTVDHKGRLTAAANGSTSLPNSGVTPGAYTLASLTVDVHGIITAASSGSVTLPGSGVTPGNYSPAAITVDIHGIVTNASNATIPPSVYQLHGDVIAGPGSGDQLATLANTAVAPGAYTLASLTVDQKGRLTAASSGTITLPNSGVAPGSYTLAGITVDAHGIVTAASNGAVTLPNSGVSPGSYSLAAITVDAHGIVTAASSVSAASVGVPAHPGYRSGIFYTRHMAGLPTGASLNANGLYCVPFRVSSTLSIDQAKITLTSGAPSGTADLGIYNNANGLPGTLLRNLGTVSITAPTGEKILTGLSLTLQPGWYWMAVWVSASCTMVGSSLSDTTNVAILGCQTLGGSAIGITGLTATVTYAAGALPSPFPTPNNASVSMPILLLRAV